MNFRIGPAIAMGSAILMISATLPMAGGHSPIEQRQAAMKTVGKSTKALGDMVKGTSGFDAAAAMSALQAMQGAVADFETKFPEGSEAADSEAAPTIWSDNAGFVGKVEAFRTSIDGAIAANPQDLDALKAAFGQVAGNCKGCHEGYRVKKS